MSWMESAEPVSSKWGTPDAGLSTQNDHARSEATWLAVAYNSGAEVSALGRPMRSLPIDHLVYATPDLNRGVEELERRTGIRASMGGQHPGWGTRNALLGLGPGRYLEIIGPDPDQPTPAKARPFGIDDLKRPRLVAWAAKAARLEHLRQAAGQAGVQLGAVLDGRRQWPDGTVLSWQLTDPWTVVAGGIVPFFIDWGSSLHPTQSAAAGLSLLDLRGVHPQAKVVEDLLHQLGIDLPVEEGSAPALFAIIEGPKGRVELK